MNKRTPVTAKILKASKYREVYSGGNHTVWCNGTNHLKTNRHAKNGQLFSEPWGACDCYKYIG